MIVTVFSLKGGCGKTTICTSLAVACLLQSRRILLVDADQQQQSLTAWRGRRLAKGRAIPITSDTQNIREQMRAEQCEVAIVDCSPRLGAGINALRREASVVVSPIVPGFFDLESLGPQVDALRLSNSLSYTLAVPSMCQPPRMGKPNAETVQAVEEMRSRGFRVSGAAIVRRKSYRTGPPQGYSGVEIDVDALEETTTLLNEINAIAAERRL